MTEHPAWTELRVAVARHDDWPDTATAAQVIDAARRFVRAVDTLAAVIEQQRAYQPPSAEALARMLETP